ncbi:MAG: hypothetical protein AAB560_00450, partial [Patescibacteria group bacterium]
MDYIKRGIVLFTINALIFGAGGFAIAPKETQAGSGSWFGPGRQEQQEQFQEERVQQSQQQEQIVQQEQVQEEQPQKKKCKWYQKCTLKKIVNALKPSNIIKTVIKTAEAALNGIKEVTSNVIEFVKKPSLKTAARVVNSVVNVVTGVAQVGFGTLFGSDGVVREGNCRIDQSTASPAKVEPLTLSLGGSFAATNCPRDVVVPPPFPLVPLGDGQGGSSAPQWEEISVEIDESVPPSVDLRVNGVDSFGSPLEAPASFLLSWTSSNAVSCSASDAWSGEKGVSGSENWSGLGRGTFIYTLTCSHSGGLSASDSVSVRVVQVPRCSLSANPVQIVRPQ